MPEQEIILSIGFFRHSQDILRVVEEALLGLFQFANIVTRDSE